jgi:hypothetical protein
MEASNYKVSGFLCDSEGNVIKCKCNKASSGVALGSEAYVTWCNKCDPNPHKGTAFVYKPPKVDTPFAQDAIPSVKFAERTVILDDWWLFGGTKWSRTLFRLRHPIVYGKRGLRKVYRSIKRLFFKERSIQCATRRKGS